MNTPSSSSPRLGEFVARHIGIPPEDQAKMLAEVGYASLDDLIDAAVPAGIRSASGLNLPEAASEAETARELRRRSRRATC